MRVPSYQIYNILNIYSKWLSRQGASSIDKFNSGNTGKFDQPNALSDRYRESIMKKVTGNIVSKITCLESNGKRSQQIAEKLKDYEGINRKPGKNNGDTFVFNSINTNSEKNTKELCIEPSSFLAKKSK